MEQETMDTQVLPARSAIAPGECCRIFDSMKIEALGFCLDRDLTILWASSPFYQKTGYTETEFQQNFHSLRQYYMSHPNEFEYIKGRLEEAVLRPVSDVELTVPVPQRGGGTVWGRMIVTFAGACCDGQMECRAYYKADGADSQEIVKEIKWVLDEFSGNVYISDIENYELLYINRTSSETLQMPAERAVGRKCYEIVQNRTSPCPFCNNHCLEKDKFYEWEYYNPFLKCTYILKDRIIEWEGRTCRLELSVDSFSSEYKLEKKDREREAILRTIPGGFARVDARDESKVLWYGGNFLQMIGYTKEQFADELQSRCSYIHPDDMAQVISTMRYSKESGTPTASEGRIITRDKKQKILTMTFSYVRGEDSWDGIASFYSIGIDITQTREEQARQRKALEEVYQAAQVASAAKTNFLSSMSHDIRTPMNAIMGMTAIAQTYLDCPERIQDCLNKINTSSRHLLGLINEVLDMSKIESGKISIELERCNLLDMVQQLTDMCRPLANEKNQKFQVCIGRLIHENVITDGGRLHQVLTNLLSNAIKYTPEGGVIVLKINEKDSAVPGKSQYEFICSDNGIGISKEFLPHMFEPFSRADDSRISKIQGTGLGMAITENIVRLMNGTITVESEENAGSTFTVLIPLEVSGDYETHIRALSGLSVLVVDDDQATCENITALLGELGMQGEWVLSGEAAVQRIKKARNENHNFYAVILDWKMPEMDGVETIRVIREKLEAHVPVIVTSAYDYTEIEDEFLKAGADAFVVKPLSKSKVLQALRLFISKEREAGTESDKKNGWSDLSGKKVLLVEDNDINREIVEELLKMHHVRVDSVENGKCAKEAYEASAPGEYDIILMDIQMPVMNGYEATAAIRQMDREDARSVPIIALTANAFSTDVAKAHSVGMNGHLAKPIEVDRLLEMLQKWSG